MRDAIERAETLAEVLGNKMECVGVADNGSQIVNSRGPQSQELGAPSYTA